MQAADKPLTEALEAQLDDGRILRGQVFWTSGAEGNDTVLCIHGLGVDSNVWQFVGTEWIKRGVNVVCFDLPGHGLSDGASRRQLNSQHMAQDLVQACRSSEIVPNIVVAQSFGNLVLLDLMSEVAKAWRIERAIAITPVWQNKSIGRRGLAKHLLRSARFVFQVGKSIGFSGKKDQSRRDHTKFTDLPDTHLPRFAAEASSIGWFAYSWLMLNLQLTRRRIPDWTRLKSLPVTIIGATNEGLWDNRQLTAIAMETGWPLHWLEMNHVALSTDPHYAPRLFALLNDQGVI